MRGDVIVFYGRKKPNRFQRILRRLILWGTRSRGEDRSNAHHVGLMVSRTHYVSAEAKVTKRRLWDGDLYNVFRVPNTAKETRDRAAQFIEDRLGERYGILNWISFLADEKLFGGKFVARRLDVDRRPVCSTLVAEAYEVAGRPLLMKDYRAVSPDDIDDRAREDNWKVITRNP